jgi:hypothetical protein
MTRKPSKTKGAKGDVAKEARLKDALKANLARRKAQARGRAGRQAGAEQAESEGQD